MLGARLVYGGGGGGPASASAPVSDGLLSWPGTHSGGVRSESVTQVSLQDGGVLVVGATPAPSMSMLHWRYVVIALVALSWSVLAMQ